VRGVGVCAPIECCVLWFISDVLWPTKVGGFVNLGVSDRRGCGAYLAAEVISADGARDGCLEPAETMFVGV
jgi:hypothetical protein